MQEQSILSRQGTEFQSGDQVHFHESRLKPYEQIEAMRLINEAFADIEAEKIIEQATLAPQVEAIAPERAEVELSAEDRIGRVGLNLAAVRVYSKSDFDLAA
jgi:hypothetical protein